MRICIDLDGVIAELKKPGQSYSDIMPVPGAVEKLKSIKKAGHYIIIQTARHMKTCCANVGLVQAKIAHDTLNWLEKYSVPYDEIYFGKPWAQIYIDDNAFRFSDWGKIDPDGNNLPTSNEESSLRAAKGK